MRTAFVLILIVALSACSKPNEEIDYNTISVEQFTTPSGKDGAWSLVEQLNFQTPTGNRYINIDFGTVQHSQTTFFYSAGAANFSIEMPATAQKRMFLISANITGTPTLTNIVE